jgi:hypothetical protein
MSAQVQDKKYNLCLIISRHELLPAQEEDLRFICQQITIKAEMPTDSKQLKELVNPYDAVIGVMPLPLQIQILQNSKTLITFAMKSVGITANKEEAERKASEYQGRTAILPPSKEGEKYRVTLYEGLKMIKEIKVIDEWLVQHPS